MPSWRRRPRLRKRSTATIRSSPISKPLARRTFMAKAPPPQRGEIWMVQFGPSVGAEIRKIRPAVVISLDTVGRLPLRIVVPLTDWQDPFAHLPWFVQLPMLPTNGLTKDSGADAFQ